MENEKDLDLSLGLPCGGGSSSSKGVHGSSSENRLDEADRGTKLINEFKNFLEGGIQQPVVGLGAPKNSHSGGIWMTNNSRSTDVEDENRSSTGEKRKNLYNEANQQKRHEGETNNPDSTENTRVSHISITTDEGSTAENEDVADSEVDGSTSKQVSQHDDASKRFVPSGSVSRVQKEVHRSGAELLGQKRFNVSSEKELNTANMPYGVSFPSQAVNMVNMAFSQAAGSAPSLPSYPLPGMMHAMGAANSERPGIQPVIPANFPLMFGYPSVQLPALDKDNSRTIISHHQQILPSYSGRNTINLDAHNESQKPTQATAPVISHKSPESTQYDGRAVEFGRSSGKQHVGEEGSSSHPESEPKGAHKIHQVKDASEQPKADALPSEFPAIRPGIAAELKFGGCGSYPNLPWVSTTAPGPNGRTISGVTYRFSPTQIRIVCACHGTHLSPEEFVRHAGEEKTAQDSGAGLASLPSNNPAASAQS